MRVRGPSTVGCRVSQDRTWKIDSVGKLGDDPSVELLASTPSSQSYASRMGKLAKSRPIEAKIRLTYSDRRLGL